MASDWTPPGWGQDSSQERWAPPQQRILAYGGFWIRVLASLIDYILIGAVCAVLSIWFLPPFHLDQFTIPGDTPSYRVNYIPADFSDGYNLPSYLPHPDFSDSPSFLLLDLIYETLFLASPLRATLGKRVLGLEVVTLAGEPISLLTSLLRTLVKHFVSFPFFLIGVLMVAFTARKQGLHDMIARTLVLRSQKIVRFDG